MVPQPSVCLTRKLGMIDQKTHMQNVRLAVPYSSGTLFTGRNEVVAKVIFLHLSVIHSVHRGGRGSASVHAGIPPPLGLHTPPDYVPPRLCTPPHYVPPRLRTPWTTYPPWTMYPLPPGKQTPAYGLRAAGKHPTGMHSCVE